MARPLPTIGAHTVDGRILLALRAGRMAPDELRERFYNWSHTCARLVDQGLIRRTGGKYSEGYELTDAGRKACPARRSPPDLTHTKEISR